MKMLTAFRWKFFKHLFLLVVTANLGLINCLSAQVETFEFHFATNSSLLDEDEIKSAGGRIKSQQFDSIRLEGHCDFRGSTEFNQTLSEARVLSVFDWITALKLPSQVKITIGAFGETRPRNTDMTAEGMAANRVVIMRLYQQKGSSSPARGNIIEAKEMVEKSPQNLEQQFATKETIQLQNIQFYGGRDMLLPESFAELKLLLDVMQKHDSLEIEIQGHICCTPAGQSDGMNMATGKMQLSYDRAVAIRDYLVRNGIEESRLKVVGKGGSSPLVYPEMTESDRTRNRRVEIKILKK
jgi:outer membrane protein OmpA-like peptidoglycan-associated protein